MRLRLRVILPLVAVAVAAMAGYGYRLHLRTQRHAAVAAAAIEVNSAQKQSQALLILASDQAGTFDGRGISLALPDEPTERARAILRALIAEYKKPDAAHTVGMDADVETVFLLPNGTAVVDLNDAFAATHPSGIGTENMSLQSMAQTLHANFPQVQRVHFLVAGAPKETLAGHADLSADYPAVQAQ
jgi:Sporulation and spore germination